MANELSKQQKLDLRYLRMARIWAENSYCKHGFRYGGDEQLHQ